MFYGTELETYYLDINSDELLIIISLFNYNTFWRQKILRKNQIFPKWLKKNLCLKEIP